MLDMVTLGETMVAFIPGEPGFLRYVKNFGMKTAGAESNVAIGLAKMGYRAGWISKLGEDEFGEFILRELRGEGVDTSHVIRDAQRRTGIMFKQFNARRETSVSYYRENSAASALCPEDIDADYIRGAKILHISGITPALSESCAAALSYAVDIARESGVLVSFDPNIRRKLWDEETAKKALLPLLSKSDIVLLGQDEGQVLLGTQQPEEIIRALRKCGAQKIAVKIGAEGAFAADGESIHRIPAVPAAVVDNIGAGDAFNAGFLCGVIENRDTKTCGEMGAYLGACAVSAYGDTEGLPSRMDMGKNRAADR